MQVAQEIQALRDLQNAVHLLHDIAQDASDAYELAREKESEQAFCRGRHLPGGEAVVVELAEEANRRRFEADNAQEALYTIATYVHRTLPV